MYIYLEYIYHCVHLFRVYPSISRSNAQWITNRESTWKLNQSTVILILTSICWWSFSVYTVAMMYRFSTLQVSFCKKATKYRATLRKMTCKQLLGSIKVKFYIYIYISLSLSLSLLFLSLSLLHTHTHSGDRKQGDFEQQVASLSLSLSNSLCLLSLR